jgi:hypothetical protein
MKLLTNFVANLGNDEPMQVFNFKAPQKDHVFLERLANKKGVAKSVLFRQAIIYFTQQLREEMNEKK